MRVANTDRIVFGTFCAFLWCLPSTSAWVASFKPAFGKVAMEIGSVGFGSALASSILLGSMPGFALAVDFTGSFSDPNHPGCPRLVSIEGNKALVSGADGNPGCLTGNGTPWNLEGKVEGDNIFIDFSPKGSPKDFTGVWEDGKNPGIRFPDGNKWSLQAKLYPGTVHI